MSVGAETKASGSSAAGAPDGGQASDEGNPGTLLLARLTLLPTLLVTGWLLVGLPLLMLGVFKPAVMLPVSIPVMAVLAYLGWRAVPGLRSGGRRAGAASIASAPWWSVAGVLAVAVAFAADQLVFHSQFVIVTRDPASYMQFAAWISGHGKLPISPDPAAFGGARGLSFQSPAFYQVGRTVTPQFMAGLPMVLSAAFWIGGINSAVLTAPILGACAVLTFGGLVARLVGARWAPLAALALALAMPLEFTSRSTYSEPLAAILFLGGLCLVADCLRAEGRAGRVLGGLAGLALGMTFVVRLDGASDILPVIPYCGLLVYARRPQVWPMIGGFVLTIFYGILDGTILTWPYLQQNITSVRPLTELTVALVVVTIAVTAVAWRLRKRGVTLRLPGWVPTAFAALTVLVVIGFAVRPYVQVVRAHSDASFQSAIAAYQLAEGQPIDPSRLYYEISLRWVFWYIGVPAVILGTIGAAILVRRCLRGQAPVWTLPLVAFAWAIFSTLYRPAITPDQPWASRRLVPAVLPGFVLLAVWAVSWGVGKLREHGLGEFGRGVVVACCAAALVIPATITSFGLTLQGGLNANGLALKRTYQGEITAVHSLCAALPKDASVIFIDSGQSKAGFELAEVVRGMCGVPTAVAEFGSAAPLMPAIRRIWATGRQPVLLDGDAAGLDDVGGRPRNVMRLHTSIDGNTLTAPPMKTSPFNLTVWMTEPSQ